MGYFNDASVDRELSDPCINGLTRSMNKKMKIMLLLSSLNAGGAERVGVSLANAWVARGYEVVLVPTYNQGCGESFYPLDPAVQVIWLSQLMPQNTLLKKVMKPYYLRRLMKSQKADIMVSFLTNVNVMSLMASAGLGIPLIVSERSHPLHQKISSGLKNLRRWLYPRADVVMLQTQEAADEFAATMPPLKFLVVMPNPLPKELTRVVPKQEAAQRVMAMGRLVSSKQFDLLIHVFGQASKQAPGWTLHIYGDGPEREKLQHLIQSLNKSATVFLEGKTTSPWEEMRESEIFAMTTRLEGFPNAMVEAMAVGLPVVAFDCPSGPAEISEEGRYADLVPLGNDKQYEAALLRLMQDADYRHDLALRGQAHVFERYGQEQVLNQWDALFTRVLGRRL